MTLQLPDPSLPWPIPMAAVALIAEREQGPGGGVALKAYRCPAGKWTIGWGETDNVRPGDTCTKEQADQWLCEDLTERARIVLSVCTVPPSQNELGAMVSLAYNVGMGWDPKGPKPRGAKDGFRQSTVLKAHNRGDRTSAARAFARWNQITNPATGLKEDSRGLTIRRSLEAALYLTPDPGEVASRMPQVVEPESKATSSPIIQGGAVTVGAGVIQAVREWGSEIGGLKPILDQGRALLTDTLGIPPNWILPAVLIGAGILVVRWRLKQRQGGWA